MTKPILVSLEGLIASGKSTFLTKLKEQLPHLHFIDEPVDQWQEFRNDTGETMLEIFYKDRQRWSYTFQNMALITRVRAINRAIAKWEEDCRANPELKKNNIFVTERCIETDFNVFAKMLHEDGSIQKVEWDIYRQWYRFLTQECKLSGIVYINCTVEKCMERISLRNRGGEDNIPLDYMKQLHNYHESWINNTSIPTLRISTQEDVSITEFSKTTTGEDGLSSFVKFINGLD